MQKLIEVFDDRTVQFIRDEILANDGNEILFRAVYKDDSTISNAEVVARGNIHSAPVKLDMIMPFNVVIHNHPSGDLTASDADVNIASYFLNNEISFIIVDNQCENINILTEPAVINKEQKIDLEKIKNVFSENGDLSNSYDWFEHRKSQEIMALKTAEVLNDGKHGIIEAPTGTGKSLAYLYPLALWSFENNRRTLVCTNTLNLQHQLIDKDIPIIKKLLDKDLKVVLVKGRNNYLCIRKFKNSYPYQEQLFEEFELDDYKKLTEWANNTKTGLKTELTEVNNELWEKISCDIDSCAGLKCLYKKECFFRIARREAVTANILIANHAIFFADMAIRGKEGVNSAFSVFPFCYRVVLDEAHNIENVATSYFGISFSYNSISKRLSRLYKKGKRRSDKGIYVLIKNIMNSKFKNSDHIYNYINDTIIPAHEDLLSKSKKLFKDLYDSFNNFENNFSSFNIRLTDKIKNSEIFNVTIFPKINELSGLILNYSKLLTNLYEDWLLVEKKDSEDLDNFFLQVLTYSKRLASDSVFLDNFLSKNDSDIVYWAEGRKWKGNPYLILQSAPLKIDSILYDLFYSRYRGVVHTSATLAVDNNVNFFENRIGLSKVTEERKLNYILPDVFNYKRTAILSIPKYFPEQYSENFIDEFSSFASRLIQVSNGRLFFLFTSWKMLDCCYDATMNLLSDEYKRACLKQGNLPRHILLDEFKKRRNGILFGVSSFWEGVDVKGDKLVGVVITKLPFQVPTEPVIQARTEMIEKSGGSSFMDYSLPNAIIKLKQGFGRLLRTKNDYGGVFILDTRIINKAYGRIFLDSLPPAVRIINDTDSIIENFSTFLEKFE